MITEFKKFMSKLMVWVLIVFSGFGSTAHAASYMTNQDFSKVVKSEVLLKTMARNRGKFYISCNLCRYINNSENIRRTFGEFWTIDKMFKVFIFGGDHYMNIARNIAWDMFKKKASYFINNEKQSMMDSADNVENLIFYIQNEVLPVYNDLLSKLGIEPVKNLSGEDLTYLCAETCRMYYCYALDFEAYVNYCYIFRI